MLTPQQNATLAADIAADPAFISVPHNSDGGFIISSAYNQIVSPAYIIWKSYVQLDEITQNGFTWTEVDGLSVGKARIWEWLFDNTTRSFNPSKANVRAGIIECWSGTAGRNAVQAVVLGHCKRGATRLEKLFSVGTGSDASPATTEITTPLSFQDVILAMGW